jgi:bacteriocin-like protein
MDLKNLMSHVVRPVNPTTTGELPAPELAQLSEEDLQQLAQLSEEDLQQIIGGVHGTSGWGGVVDGPE